MSWKSRAFSSSGHLLAFSWCCVQGIQGRFWSPCQGVSMAFGCFFLLLTLSLAYLRPKCFAVWVKLLSQDRAPAAVLSGQRQQARPCAAISFFPNLGLIKPKVKFVKCCRWSHPLPSSNVGGGNALAVTQLQIMWMCLNVGGLFHFVDLREKSLAMCYGM